MNCLPDEKTKTSLVWLLLVVGYLSTFPIRVLIISWQHGLETLHSPSLFGYRSTVTERSCARITGRLILNQDLYGFLISPMNADLFVHVTRKWRFIATEWLQSFSAWYPSTGGGI